MVACKLCHLKNSKRKEAGIMGYSKQQTDEITSLVEKKKTELSQRKKDYLMPKTQKGDNSRYLKHALESVNLPPIDIRDAKAVEERVKWYFNHCIDNDMKPGVTGLCNALGISRMTFNNWEQGRKITRGEHTVIMQRAKNIIEEIMEQYMMNGKINPVSGIFLMKNNFDGYYDRQDLVVTPNSPLDPEKDREELERKYSDNDIIEEDNI